MKRPKDKILWFESNDEDLNFLVPLLIERLGYDLIIAHEKGDVGSWLSEDEVDESWFSEIEQLYVKYQPPVLIKFLNDPWDNGHDFCRLVRTSQLDHTIGLIFINPIAHYGPPRMIFPDNPCRADVYLRVPFSTEEFQEKLEKIIRKYKPID